MCSDVVSCTAVNYHPSDDTPVYHATSTFSMLVQMYSALTALAQVLAWSRQLNMRLLAHDKELVDKSTVSPKT